MARKPQSLKAQAENAENAAQPKQAAELARADFDAGTLPDDLYDAETAEDDLWFAPPRAEDDPESGDGSAITRRASAAGTAGGSARYLRRMSTRRS